jgi:hypothetical protein
MNMWQHVVARPTPCLGYRVTDLGPDAAIAHAVILGLLPIGGGTRELKALGTSRARTLGSVITVLRGIHRNYVINPYSHKVSSYIT